MACDAPMGRFCVDYYRGQDLAGAPIASSKTPFIRYNWKQHSPARHVPYDHFSGRWQGYFQFPEQNYNFLVKANDGVRVLIDGKPIMDAWTANERVDQNISTQVSVGKHLVEVEYFENTEDAYLEVSWSKAADLDTAINQETSELQSNPKTGAADQSLKSAELSPIKTYSGTEFVRSTLKNKPPLGINLSLFDYYSSSVPFKDLIKQTGAGGLYQQGSNEPCRQSATMNAEGYPNTIPNGCVFRLWSVFHIPDDEFWPKGVPPYKPGRYILTYQGQASIHLGWDAKQVNNFGNGRIEFEVPSPSVGIQIEVTQTNSSDPIRDMHMVHVDDEGTYKQQPFNERWLNILKPFGVIRFKDWIRTDELIPVYSGKVLNHSAMSLTLPANAPKLDITMPERMVALINVDDQWPRVFIERYDSLTRTLHLKTPIEVSKSATQPTISLFELPNLKWSDRTKPTTLGQTTTQGVAFESMIQLSNLLNADPWITVPTAAHDDFVENLAKLIKNQLKPGLKCYLEYSNETWNFNYPGYHYSEAKVRQMGLVGAVVPADAWHAYRAVEIFKIFNRVFAEPDLSSERQNSRLVRVLTSQTAWFDRAKAVMDWQMPGNGWPTEGKAAYQFADAWASTAYFGSQGDALEQSSLDELAKLQIDEINTMFGTQNSPGILRKLLNEAKNRKLQFITYEAGAGILAPAGKKDLVAKGAKSNTDSSIRQVYSAMFKNWIDLYREFGPQTLGVWTQYYDVGRYANYGYWGMLQSTYQDPAAAPKYQAFIDYASQP